MEKSCKLIGINLDGSRLLNADLCPPILKNVGAVFVPFSPAIIQHALTHPTNSELGDYYYAPEIYKNLGYKD